MSSPQDKKASFRLVHLISEGIDIGPLLSAFDQFHSALPIAKSDLEKAGVIQYFEFTYELAWKTMRRVLAARGKVLNSPKVVFREAGLEGFIDHPETWFGFLEDRNQTVHTYSREVADSLFQNLFRFDEEMVKFVEKLKNLS